MIGKGNTWVPGSVPVAVIMISLNEAHNLRASLESLRGWASQVFLVDSYSSDQTVDIALEYGVTVVQRKFGGFGNQWNFALTELPLTAPWTLKLDPDERLTDDLKAEIAQVTANDSIDMYSLPIRLYFMGRRLPSVLQMNRLWRTGKVVFSDVMANEHALCKGPTGVLKCELMHLDSPSLDHWVSKQNKYTTAEAASQYAGRALATPPRLFGNALERRMWLKKFFWRFPCRYTILFLYHLVFIGAWRCGKVGWIWSHLRTEVYRQWEYKYYEFTLRGGVIEPVPLEKGVPDDRVMQFN